MGVALARGSAVRERDPSAVENCLDGTGRSTPLGATVVAGGVNFSVFSRNASAVELVLFDREDAAQPARVIPIDPVTNRAYHYWHVFVPGLQQGQLYGYRVQGPFDPSSGMRFNPAKVLLDPYGRGVVVPQNYSREAARLQGDNATVTMLSLGLPMILMGDEVRRTQHGNNNSYCQDGSTLVSTPRAISSNGRPRHRFRAPPTGLGPAPWSCFSLAWLMRRVQLCNQGQRRDNESSEMLCP